MNDPELLERMRSDWNERAGKDAYYYVAFGRHQQEDEEFFATAADVLRLLTADLKRLHARDAALEIGCGPGRLMRPLSHYFREIHGVDVSDQMVRRAADLLRHTANAHPHLGTGSDLAMFASERFDFVYSYAVFQHIPSRDVVFNYLREAWRVLRPGGILRCQINGLPAHARRYDTWSGVRISPDEIAEFTRNQGFRLLALEQIWTQYMWITCRKLPDPQVSGRGVCAIRNISNALTGERAAPSTGPMAALSLWIEHLPVDCDLNNIAVWAEGLRCRVSYIGEPEPDGVSQVNAALPERIRTGVLPVSITRDGQEICPPRKVRIIPAGPSVPHVSNVTDGVNLLSGNRITSGIVKVTMMDLASPEIFGASVDGVPVPGVEWFCVDPVALRYEFNVPIPSGVASGTHQLGITLGTRALPPVAIEVA